MKPITQFINDHYHHFNASTLKRAVADYVTHISNNGAMMITLAGAMSTAEIGRSLADLIRADRVHAISCTGANLEEDVFNAVAHNHYHLVPNYRDLSPQDEQELLDRHLNRVTDTCIPEQEAFRYFESKLLKLWSNTSHPKLPHEYIYELIRDPSIQNQFQIPLEHSWVLAAAEKNLPIFVPGWEDSTLGNIFVAASLRNDVDLLSVKSGLSYMVELINWYKTTSSKQSIGFFQIGGGIAGDFPICVVPLLTQDLEEPVPVWDYFCQITDATESYGGYSGAHPNEKITWGKLAINTPKFVINSDASIVAPLMFTAILEH